MCPSNTAPVYEGYALKYDTYQYKVAQEDHYVYDQKDPTRYVATSTRYQYNSYGQPVAVRTTQSDQATFWTLYKYPFDYNAAAMGGTMGTLQTKHMLNRVIEQRVTRNGAAISGTVTEYDADGQAVKVYQLQTPVPLTTGLHFDPAQINPNPDYYPQRIALTYDAAKNVTSQQQVVGNVNVAYLWGYNRSYPIAEIRNATYAEVEAVLTPAVVAQLAGDSLGTDAQVRQALQVLRTDARLQKAQVTTYTYQPLVGITSATDAAGVTTYYEYDALQRLKRVKDQDSNIVKQYVYHYQGQ